MAWTLAAASTPTTAGARRPSRTSSRRWAWGLRARTAGVNFRESGCIVEDLAATGLGNGRGHAATPRVRARDTFARARETGRRFGTAGWLRGTSAPKGCDG